VGGHATHTYFSTTGLSEGGDGNPGGPGILTSDVTDPLILRFHVLDSSDGQKGAYDSTIMVNFNPLTSADATDHNPIAAP
jgi:hypothetical protein